MHIKNKTVVLLLLCISFVCLASEEEELSNEILTPIINTMKTGELYRASLPTYNQYRNKQGKPPLAYSDLKPLFDKTAEISEQAYLSYFSKEFSLDELKYLKELFSTDIGQEIFSKLAKSITTGVANKPEFERFNNDQKLEFNKVASRNLALSQGFSSRVQNVNNAVQKHVAEEFKKYPKLKALINQ